MNSVSSVGRGSAPNKKILINGSTLDGANLAPLLAKVDCWERNGWDIVFIGSDLLKGRINAESNAKDLERRFIRLSGDFRPSGKMSFILQALRKNLELVSILRNVRGEFDVVYSISSVLDLIIFPFLLRRVDGGVKWATVFDNIVPLSEPGNKAHKFLAWIFFRISLLLLRKADRIYAISEELRAFLITMGFPEGNIIVTGNAVESGLIRRARNVPSLGYDALYVGRINEAKGIYDMLEVLRIVVERYPDFRLALMGEGDPTVTARFENVVGEMRLGKNVVPLGSKRGLEKFEIIKSCRSFWFLSTRESFGLALLEAVCCGIPAFAYDLPAYAGIYKHSEVQIFEKGDYREVARKVLALFDGAVFVNEPGQRLLSEYNWDEIACAELNAF
jgi:glycosyltransferase involved in cell wall biosynthesis